MRSPGEISALKHPITPKTCLCPQALNMNRDNTTASLPLNPCLFLAGTLRGSYVIVNPSIDV